MDFEADEHLKNISTYKLQLEEQLTLLEQQENIKNNNGGKSPFSSSKINAKLRNDLKQLLFHNQQIINALIQDTVQWKKSYTIQHFSLFSEESLFTYTTNPYLFVPFRNNKWPQESTISNNSSEKNHHHCSHHNE